MGKGTIIQNYGKGKYQVDVEHETSRPARMVEYYTGIVAGIIADTIPPLETEKTAALAELNVAQASVDAKAATWQVAQTSVLELTQQIHDKKLEINTTPPPGPDELAALSAELESLEDQLVIAEKTLETKHGALVEEIRHASFVQSDYDLAARAVNDAYADLLAAEKNLAKWQDRADFPATDYQDLWCVDLSGKTGEAGYPEIPVGTEVGLLDLDHVNGTIVIDSAYPTGDTNKYDSSYGKGEPTKAQTENGWFYNFMVYPGTVTWRNKWGAAVITAIDYDLDTCSIKRTVTAGSEDALPNGISWDTSTITDMTFDDVSIVYMECGARAFVVDDEVVILFTDAGVPDMVIGFVSNPKPCPVEMAVQFYDSVNDNFPRLTYDPDTGIWSRTTDVVAFCGQVQFLRGLDMISCHLPTGAGTETDVFWNRVNQGSAVSGLKWSVRAAWIDEDDRLICVSSYYDGDVDPSERGWDVSTKTGGGSWTSIHRNGPATLANGGESAPAYGRGLWISDNGKTSKWVGSSGGTMSQITINATDITLVESQAWTIVGTNFVFDPDCVDLSTADRDIIMWEGSRADGAERVSDGYLHATVGVENAVVAHEVIRSTFSIGSAQSDYPSGSTDLSFSSTESHESASTVDFSLYGFNARGFRGPVDVLTEGPDASKPPTTAEQKDAPYGDGSEAYRFFGYVTDAAIKRENRTAFDTSGDVRTTVMLNGKEIAVIADFLKAPKTTETFPTGGPVGKIPSCAGITIATAPESLSLAEFAPVTSTTINLSVHPTGVWSALVLSVVWAPVADHGLHLSTRGKSNDLLPEWADCIQLGQLDGYDPDPPP